MGKYIGANALRNSFKGDVPHTLILENIDTIGYGFMNNSDYRGKVTLPDGLSSIGASAFLNANYITEVYIPASLPAPTDNSDACLSTNNSTAPSYVNGIILSGPGARAWKEALPDQLSGTYYRKLVLDPKWS